MSRKSLLVRLLYFARDLRSRKLFEAIRSYCRGDVLDVGGWDFYLTAKRKGASFRTWTTLEHSRDRLLEIDDEGFEVVHGDGCDMSFEADRFDTVLNLQVLEHVFEPIEMVREIGRVLRPGGHAIFLIPQTSTTHLAPQFYGNFTRYWVLEAMTRSGLQVVHLHPLGGIWSSMASHFFYFFLQSWRVAGMSDPAHRRNLLFYLLYPLMVGYALISLPICLLLSFGDLREEPNNHLVVARKPADH